MSGKLNTFVHVHQDGQSKAYGPNDTIPTDVARLITNPNVWETPPVLVEAETEVNSSSKGETGGGPGDGSDGASSGDDQRGAQGSSETPIPPKGGKGSSATAWAAYAASKGFAVEEDAKASEIIDALAEAGIPTE